MAVMAKKRYNILLEEITREQGDALAKGDKRSFSGQVAWLIDQELERRSLGKEKNSAAARVTQTAPALPEVFA